MKQKGNGGFTIVELLVATIVGLILITATESTVTSYLHTSQTTTSLVLANSFAEGEMESLRSAGYNAINLGTTDITSQMPSALNPPRSATLVVSNPSGVDGIKQIDLTISYNDQNTTRTYSYTTYIGELGVGQ